MKKQFRLEGLDCANCAAKMEKDIGALSGVTTASVNHMTTKLVFETAEGAERAELERLAEVLDQREVGVDVLAPQDAVHGFGAAHRADAHKIRIPLNGKTPSLVVGEMPVKRV